MGRHTFGTMCLSAGVPIESIAKMMGHASIASTQIYAQVTDCKISEDMDRLIAKHQEKNKENDTMETEAITIGAMMIVNASRNKSMEETA